jgi:hypothetical protein
MVFPRVFQGEARVFVEERLAPAKGFTNPPITQRIANNVWNRRNVATRQPAGVLRP